LREYRGDSHVNAWTAAGFDAVEIGLLTELYWGLPLRTYIRSRGWSDAEFDAAEARLEQRGLIVDGVFTERGREAREAVEVATDLQMRPAMDQLGDSLDELVNLFGRWSQAIQAGAGYPASGPHELAAASRAGSTLGLTHRA
jgi:hypothetical protein